MKINIQSMDKNQKNPICFLLSFMFADLGSIFVNINGMLKLVLFTVKVSLIVGPDSLYVQNTYEIATRWHFGSIVYMLSSYSLYCKFDRPDEKRTR